MKDFTKALLLSAAFSSSVGATVLPEDADKVMVFDVDTSIGVEVIQSNPVFNEVSNSLEAWVSTLERAQETGRESGGISYKDGKPVGGIRCDGKTEICVNVPVSDFNQKLTY